MKRLLPVLLTLAVLLGSAGEGWSADFQKGLDAYNKKDFATALREWKPLAEQGDADAQLLLGDMYKTGKGVPRNDKTAVKWFRLAAKQGYAGAQYNLGVMYRQGQGVPQNDETAVKWYRLAAKQGLPLAQSNLGFMYANGLGTPENFIRAHMWWNIAGLQGLKIAKKWKEKIAKMMTPAHISEAQDLARECIGKKYRGC